MTLTPREVRELCARFSALHDGRLSAAEAAELGDRLLNNGEARRLYVRYSRVCSGLNWDLSSLPDTAQEVASTSPAASRPTSAPAARSAPGGPRAGDRANSAATALGGASPATLAATAVLASALTAVVVLSWTRAIAPSDVGQGPAAESAGPAIDSPWPSTTVAHLTSTNGCDWGEGGIWTVGQGMKTGDEITLYEGIAEFRLASGASLSIEGPVSLVLSSPTSLALLSGRLTLHAPWSTGDFAVLAGGAAVSASDAELGVCVRDDRVDLHVFSGDVVAAPATAARPSGAAQSTTGGGEAFEPLNVAAGSSLSLIGPNSTVEVLRWGEADESAFATRLPMAGPLPITQQYVDAVLKSRPAGYWRFETQSGPNLPSEFAEAGPLSMVGNLRLSGDAANRVVEFGRPGADGYLIGAKALPLTSGSEYTVEGWFKPSHRHRGALVSLVAAPVRDSEGGHAFFLELQGTGDGERQGGRLSDQHAGQIRFLHRNPPGSSSSTGVSCFSEPPYRLRRWQHVAAVKQGSEMRLYVDGRLAARGTDESPLAIEGLRLLLGQTIATRRVNAFIGQLDELAVYDRALSEDEVAEHCAAVEWEPEPRDAEDSESI